MDHLILFDKDKFDNFQLKQNYNYNNKTVGINGFIDLTNSKVLVSRLNYKKDFGKKSKLNFNFNYLKNKFYNIKELNFSELRKSIIRLCARSSHKFTRTINSYKI